MLSHVSDNFKSIPPLPSMCVIEVLSFFGISTFFFRRNWLGSNARSKVENENNDNIQKQTLRCRRFRSINIYLVYQFCLFQLQLF